MTSDRNTLQLPPQAASLRKSHGSTVQLDQNFGTLDTDRCTVHVEPARFRRLIEEVDCAGEMNAMAQKLPSELESFLWLLRI